MFIIIMKSDYISLMILMRDIEKIFKTIDEEAKKTKETLLRRNQKRGNKRFEL